MPSSNPRPIPLKQTHSSSGDRDRDRDRDTFTAYRDNSATNTNVHTAAALSISVSPTRAHPPYQQGFRRRSSTTIKSALSSILGSSPPQHQMVQNNHLSTDRTGGVKAASSFSAGSGSSNYSKRSSVSSGSRRHSIAVERVQKPFSSCSDSDDSAHLEDNDGVGGLYNDDNLSDHNRLRQTASDSIMLDPHDTSESLRSFGKNYLSEYLTERGLLPPVTILDNQNVRISLATSGDNVFLPTMSSNDDEYLARLNGLRGEEDVEVQQDNDESVLASMGERPSTAGGQRSASTNDPPIGNGENGENGNRQIPSPIGSEYDSSDPSSRAAFEIDSSMATYTLAVILSLSEPTKLSFLKAELCSRVRVYWPNGVPPTKTFHEEFYCVGNVNWDLCLENVNLFVPKDVSSSEKIINNNTNLRPFEVFKNNAEAKRNYLDKNKSKKQLLKLVKTSKKEQYQPGDYVFVIPVVFTNAIPESLYLPSARVNYRFRIAIKLVDPLQPDGAQESQDSLSTKTTESESSGAKKLNLFKKLKNNLHLNTSHPPKEDFENPNNLYAEYPINIVRTPPLYSISTANKPVYINRVWADSLSYEISFAHKYVSLGSKVPIRIKLAPLTKNICLKRIRISVVEKITFVSKNCEYEYDQIDPVAKDPYNPYYSEFSGRRKKERNLSLLEIRTKEKGSRAIREEIVENCVDDNLLAYTSLKDDNGEDGVGLTEPLTISTNLEFPKYIDMDKNTARVIPPYGIDIYAAIPNPELSGTIAPNNRGGVIGFLANRKNSLTPAVKNTEQAQVQHQSPLSQQPIDSRFHETTFTHDSMMPVECQTRLNRAKRGLYLDSLHFSNIYSRHKLEIMLRVSKPDAKDPEKFRHYEVLIDTPIFLVSDLCNSGNMELPTYDMATNDRISPEMSTSAPPTFEEAISIPGSPLNSPIMAPIGSSRIWDGHVPDDLNNNNLNLSRSASLSGISPLDGASTGAAMAVSSSVDANERFNNLDHLLTSSNKTGISESPRGFTSNFNNIREENESPRPNEPSSPIFKRNYSVATETPSSSVRRIKFGTDYQDDSVFFDDDTAHDPPSYDEVVPLMSDEE